MDTNVISELLRPRPNPHVLEWARQTKAIALSAISVEEIEYGLAWKPNPRVQQWFASFFTEFCEVIPVTDEIARRAGQQRGKLAAAGKSRTQADMLIAATAAERNLILVTRNTRDFEDCDIKLLNPFEE